MTSSLDTVGVKALEPCPFCGGKPEWNLGQRGDGTPWRYLACEDCEAMGPHVADWELSAVAADNDSVLTAAWNRRASALAAPVTPQAVEGEPVAWRAKLSDIDGHCTYSNKKLDDRFEPLYASPQPAPHADLVEALHKLESYLYGKEGGDGFGSKLTRQAIAALSAVSTQEGDGEIMDDPWAQVGFLKEKLRHSEAEVTLWKDRAFAARVPAAPKREA